MLVAKLRLPGRADDLAIGIACPLAIEIFLVIFLGDIPVGQLFDGRDDRLTMRRLRARNRSTGFSFPLGRMREYRRAVLRPDIAALPVQLRRVADLEKDIEHIVETGDGGIKRQPNCFRMPRRPAANLALRRVRHMPANIAAFDALDARQPVKHGLDTPGATGGECSDLLGHGRGLLRAGRPDMAARKPTASDA